MKKKYYTVYQITDLTNNYIYIGVHSTNNLNDNYYGSGNIIRRIIKKRGRKSLTKKILFIFNDKQKMLEKEEELVNKEFLQRKDVYNLTLGGTFNTTGLTTVKDKNGNSLKVHVEDPRYLSGQLVGITKGFVPAKDKDGNTFQVTKDDSRFLSGEIFHVTKGTTPVKDKTGKVFRVDVKDPRLLSGELISFFDKKIAVKDKAGNYLRVEKDDPRFLSGELVGTTKGLTFETDLKTNILKLRRKGYSYSKIVKELNCSISTVSYHCSKLK